MNTRYYAGKQIICEFVGVTKWKVAICGEYMKTRLKTCSHGSACNFIHCFRNPGGDYEWADWDNPPPRYWIKRMIFLFGTSVESGYDKALESENYRKHRESKTKRNTQTDRHKFERFHYKEMDMNNSSSDGEELNSKKFKYNRYSVTGEHSIKRRGHRVSEDKNEHFSEYHRSEEHVSSKNFGYHSDDASEEHDRRHERRHETEDRSSFSRRKRKVYSEEKEKREPKSHKNQNKKQVKDWCFGDSELNSERTHSLSNGDSFSKHSLRSKDQFNEKYSSENLDSEKYYGGVRYHYSSQSGQRRKYEHSSKRPRSHPSHEHRCVSGKIRKGKGSEEESDESPGRWKVSEEHFQLEET